jgi:hypothetical protein
MATGGTRVHWSPRIPRIDFFIFVQCVKGM